MRQIKSGYGTLHIGSDEELFSKATEWVLGEASKRQQATVGLPGGSTPQRWFKWIVDNEALNPAAAERIMWLASDERYVPLHSPESNFGNAERHLLDPLHVPDTRRMPWPTQVDPHSASIVFNRRWNERYGLQRCFDLCFLGSPIIGLDTMDNFASVDVPGKGWRLTITERGLGHCGRIVVLVTGTAKAGRLTSVLNGTHDPHRQPVQLLREHAERTDWLLDEAAAAELA